MRLPRSLTASQVIDALAARDLLALTADVCRTWGVKLDDVCGRARMQSVSRARQEIWWRLRNDPERHFTLLEIARLFGRDHATVFAGIAAHERRQASHLHRSPLQPHSSDPTDSP